MIRDILILQKREIEKRLKEDYIKRDVTLKNFKNNLIKVIIGPRRAGKSFFSIHMLNEQGIFGYANFDDEKLVEAKDYNEIINIINSLYKNPEYILLDEIQNLDNWELFVNRLQRQGYNLVITGSNSNLLSKELATHLTGRHLSVNIFPFSFKEFIKIENKELTENEIKEKLNSYMISGGYPEVVVKRIDYKEYLSTLFDSTLYKDIIKRFKIRDPSAVEDLAVYLISNIASEFSYNRLSKVSKSKSVHTIQKYLSYLKEAFIFFEIPRFSFKVKEQLSSNKKIYCIDNGFINSKSFKVSHDNGKLYENLVAIRLKEMEFNNIFNIYFWRNIQNEEVDFVVKEGLKIKQLIQVCYNLDDIKTKEREIRALIKSSKELKCNNLLVITESYEKEESLSWFGIKRKVKFLPLWKWLLE